MILLSWKIIFPSLWEPWTILYLVLTIVFVPWSNCIKLNIDIVMHVLYKITLDSVFLTRIKFLLEFLQYGITISVIEHVYYSLRWCDSPVIVILKQIQTLTYRYFRVLDTTSIFQRAIKKDQKMLLNAIQSFRKWWGIYLVCINMAL